MSKNAPRDFDTAAAHWDDKPQRRMIAAAVTAAIVANIPLHHDMQILEYGCGTGLCGLQLALKTGHLTAADTSTGMLEQLKRKTRSLGLDNVTPVLIPPSHWPLPAEAFDLVFSSMALHHIEGTRPLLDNFYRSLKPGGFLAIADLEKEDGTFHGDPTGVAHCGFDTRVFFSLLEDSGFIALDTQTVHTIRKQRGNSERCYPVFLMTGQKPLGA